MGNRRDTLKLLIGMPLLGCMGKPMLAHAQGIAEEGFVAIGGLEQWISVRGESANAPILLFLHGGPGEAMSPFVSLFAPWETVFTVALWDQRGSGRTFGRDRTGQGEVTLKRLADDVIEIAEYLRVRFGKEKIVLAGQSWGSILGWTSIRLRPDLFHAYVGTGQAVGWARAIPAQEEFARAQAEAAGDAEALAAMDAAQTLPVGALARTAPLRPWIMPPADLAFLEVQSELIGSPPFPETGEIADWLAGFRFAAEALIPAVLAFDAYAAGGPAADVPVVVIQGRDDKVTPTVVAEQFVADLRAPSKALAVIDGGHFACYTNGESFAAALADHVRPLVD